MTAAMMRLFRDISHTPHDRLLSGRGSYLRHTNRSAKAQSFNFSFSRHATSPIEKRIVGHKPNISEVENRV